MPGVEYCACYCARCMPPTPCAHDCGDRMCNGKKRLNQTEAHRQARLRVRERSARAEAFYEARKRVREAEADALITPTRPRPAWMDDPSLLPKRPPGVAA